VSPPTLPSLDIAESVKSAFTEADVHSKLFEPDMAALGFPPRVRSQADGEYFLEQGHLALRRLRTKLDRRQRGHYDGLYLMGNSPVVLCEIKRFDAIDSPAAFAEAVRQLKGYAASEDFETPPPFLLLYCGKPSRNRFFRRRSMVETSGSGPVEYEELSELWTWERVKDAHARGRFAEEVVTGPRLLEILLHHLDRIEDDLRRDVGHAVQIVTAPDPASLMLTPFGRWLVARPEALRLMRRLYERKVAELGRENERQLIEEMVTQAALNYLNKVFFLNLCEDRNLEGFYRIMREFLPATRSETTPTTAAVFLALLRRKIRDSAGEWRSEDERAYRELRGDLTGQIREHVIEQNHWWELIRVAFDLAEERFPLVYREDAYDDFHPRKETLAELVYDLSTKSFRGLTNHHVGDIYQQLLSSRRRRAQQSKLGAFYTPQRDVDYMVSRLRLSRDSRVLDPCMGSGHFLEGIYEQLAALYRAEGFAAADAYQAIVGRQLYGADIDTFATSLSAIRLFLLDEQGTRTQPNLFVHDMLLHTPERPGAELFSPEVLATEGRERAAAERVVAGDPGVDAPAPIDELTFDAIVGNPPYGAKKPKYKESVYRRLFGTRTGDRAAGSVATGDADSYSMFFVSAIERLREGGRLCLITNDSFRSLSTHGALRRHILDRCKIVEILLTDTRHFEGVSFQFAGMAITTLEKCADRAARAVNEMRLVDSIRDPADFSSPPPEKVTVVRQQEYEALLGTPFFVGVPREVFESAKSSGCVRDVARGRQGLATADDRRFLAGIDRPFPGLTQAVAETEVTTIHSDDERARGIAAHRPHWVPFAKGEGFGDYWRPAQVAIDWSEQSVAELERRNRLPAGTAAKPRLQNRGFYFSRGLSYSVISSGRVSARLMPEGWVFGHKGSAIFVEENAVDELFVLGYLNSALATYFMKKLVNTTATADVGYVERLPFRRPKPAVEALVTDRVRRIVAALQDDPGADVQARRDEIDDAIFDLFEIRSAREEIRRFYRTVGLVERPAPDQAAAAAGSA